MIEQILQKAAGVFRYGEVEAVDTVKGKARVRLGSEGSAWIETTLSLTIGDAVIVARNADASRFIVQSAEKSLPSQGVLVLI